MNSFCFTTFRFFWSCRICKCNSLANKLQLGLDVVDEQRHVAVQVELRHLEDERVAQHRHARHAVDLTTTHYKIIMSLFHS